MKKIATALTLLFLSSLLAIPHHLDSTDHNETIIATPFESETQILHQLVPPPVAIHQTAFLNRIRHLDASIQRLHTASCAAFCMGLSIVAALITGAATLVT